MEGMASRIRSHLEQKAENSIVEALDRLLGKIYNLVTDECSLMLSLEEELEFLRRIHPELMEVIVNAEVKPEETDILMAVKEFYYDGKDIVEKFDSEVAHRQLNGAHLSDLEMEGQQSCTARMGLRLKFLAIRLFGEQNFKDISLFLKPLCGCFFPDDFSFFFFRRKIAIKIRDLYDALRKVKSSTDRIANFKNEIMGGLQNMHVAKGGSIEGRKVVYEKLPKDFLLVGRDDVKKEIKDLLLNKPEVISSAFSSSGYSRIDSPCALLLWGMGGIGKTTLVHTIYDDPDVKKHFKVLKKWVCVGDDELDPDKVMEEIIKKGKTLEGKRFLIILDDVWNMEKQWEKLWCQLSYGAEGSWIIITTRVQDVEKQLGSTPAVVKKLNPLGEEECLQIFERYAFPPTIVATSSSSSSSTGCNIPGKFWDMTMLIVRKKIRGVPLTAKVIGSSLRAVRDEFLWKEALETIKDGDIKSALTWSYRHLPTLLKRCFAYFSIYPKDHIIYEDDIINHWMAFGYLERVDGINGDVEMRKWEDVGRMYVGDLVRASLLELHHTFDSYKMHDLIHDVAMSVSDHKVVYGKRCKPRPRTIPYFNDGNWRHSHLQKLWGLGISDCSHVNTFQDDQLQTVRILYIGRNVSVPTNFPNLVHLRFLNLHFMSELKYLPESVCNLHNLQILDLPPELKKLPEGMCKLVNLRHILGGDDISFARVPRVGELTWLQTIGERGHFALDKNGGECIVQLKNMKQLRTCLNISGLRHVTSIQWAREAELDNKVHLQSLILNVEEDMILKASEAELDNNVHLQRSILNIEEDMMLSEEDMERNEDDMKLNEVSDIELFNNLKPHRNLKVLEIRNYRGDELPTWLGGHYHLNIVSLTLSHCHGLMKLPPLGQLYNLEKLHFWQLHTIERIGAEVCSTDLLGGKISFRSLKQLRLQHMYALEEWEEPKGTIKCFPLLEELHVEECEKLRCLPTISSTELREFFVEGVEAESDVVVKCLNQMHSSRLKVRLRRVYIGSKVTLGSHFDKLVDLEMAEIFKLRSLDIQGLSLLRRLRVGQCDHLEEMLVPNQFKTYFLKDMQRRPSYLGIAKFGSEIGWNLGGI